MQVQRSGVLAGLLTFTVSLMPQRDIVASPQDGPGSAKPTKEWCLSKARELWKLDSLVDQTDMGPEERKQVYARMTTLVEVLEEKCPSFDHGFDAVDEAAWREWAGLPPEKGDEPSTETEPAKEGSKKWVWVGAGGAAAATAALLATGGGDDQHSSAGSPSASTPTTTTTTTTAAQPALPSVVSLSGTKRGDSCGQDFYPTQLNNPSVQASFDGTNLTVHSSADVTGPFDSATGEWIGSGLFQGPFGTGTETYAGTWTFEGGRWVFRGTLTFEYDNCLVIYDVTLVGVG